MYFRNSACSQCLQKNRWIVSEPPCNDLVTADCRWHYAKRMHIQSLLKRGIKSEIFSVWRKKSIFFYPITFIHVEIKSLLERFLKLHHQIPIPLLIYSEHYLSGETVWANFPVGINSTRTNVQISSIEFFQIGRLLHKKSWKLNVKLFVYPA
jgi:hypothetical protein